MNEYDDPRDWLQHEDAFVVRDLTVAAFTSHKSDEPAIFIIEVNGGRAIEIGADGEPPARRERILLVMHVEGVVALIDTLNAGMRVVQ
jgi:hypothetical protein